MEQKARNDEARNLIRQIRDVSSWQHPARDGLGGIIDRAYALATTSEDIESLRAMLAAVTA